MSNAESSRRQTITLAERNIYLFTTQVELFKQQRTKKSGLNATDFACACLLAICGPLTAGQLAERSSLTTGAITSVIDRLEHADYVVRISDPKDRRRIIVQLAPTARKKMSELFGPIDLKPVWAQYDDQEIKTIQSFLERLTAMY